MSKVLDCLLDRSSDVHGFRLLFADKKALHGFGAGLPLLRHSPRDIRKRGY